MSLYKQRFNPLSGQFNLVSPEAYAAIFQTSVDYVSWARNNRGKIVGEDAN